MTISTQGCLLNAAIFLCLALSACGRSEDSDGSRSTKAGAAGVAAALGTGGAVGQSSSGTAGAAAGGSTSSGFGGATVGGGTSSGFGGATVGGGTSSGFGGATVGGGTSSGFGGTTAGGGTSSGFGGVVTGGTSFGFGGSAFAGEGGTTAAGGTETGGAGELGGEAGSGTGGLDASGGGDPGFGGASTASPPFVNTYDGSRDTTVSLDQTWRFNLGDESGAHAVGFDDSSWSTVDVPHDWSIGLPFNQSSAASFGGGYLDGGLGWYRKTFTIPAATAGQRVFVQFDGIYMDSTVWLNGTEICARPYGYASFECDLTANVNVEESNVLAVRVNNELPSSRWYSGSGIYRHVWLKTVNPVHVAYTGIFVTTPEISAGSATVNIKASIQNQGSSGQSVTVESSIRDASNTEVGQAASPSQILDAGATLDLEQTGSVSNPALWSPATPTMYSVVTTVSVDGAIVDTYVVPFGIRHFAFDANTGFSLNGTAMKLNGVCLHHDLGALGAAVNHRAMEMRLELLKEMGANAIRTSHNPPAPELLDFADRLGLFVVDEAFDMWYGSKTEHDYGRFFRDWADTDMRDFVARDRNHPSVIIWSLGNEIPQAGDRAVAQQLIDDVRVMDDTRMTTQAYAAWVGLDSFTGLEDLVGINYAPERYDTVHASNPAWKLFASESSSGFRSRGIYDNNNTQATSYDTFAAGWGHTAETSWRNVNTRPFIAGEFIWTGFDYIGEPTPYEWPAKSSYFGIIDTANLPKDIFYFYQSRWNYEGPPMVHIVPVDWSSWSVGQSVRVVVYSNAERVELLLNGESLGELEVDPAEADVEWSVRFEPGTLEARASSGGVVVATDTVRTAGDAAALVLTVDRPAIAADGRDLAFVEVNVVDADGVIVPRASNLIEFTIEGPGFIAGLDNGDATSHESYKGSSRSAFSGKAMAIVQAQKTPGQITLSATSSGLSGSSVVVMTGTP